MRAVHVHVFGHGRYILLVVVVVCYSCFLPFFMFSSAKCAAGRSAGLEGGYTLSSFLGKLVYAQKF